MNYFSTAEQEKQLTSAVTCALASLNLNGKTDVEKVIAIHNYICDHVDYDYDGLSVGISQYSKIHSIWRIM